MADGVRCPWLVGMMHQVCILACQLLMVTVQKTIIAFLLLIESINAPGQNLPVLHPTLGSENIYTKREHQMWLNTLDVYSKIESGNLAYETLSQQEKERIDSLEMGYGPLTQGPGCSWYCGGQMYKVTSSSYLKEQNKVTYAAGNLHDFDLFTAWVPDNLDTTQTGKINFYFKPLSPRVREIVIYNGYIKTIDLWKANSRVKSFKLYINGRPHAILELKDVTAAQSFQIDPIRSTDKKKDLVITLEIVATYKGTKSNDVVISEINFDGLDVH